jgi:hypothetical protein
MFMFLSVGKARQRPQTGHKLVTVVDYIDKPPANMHDDCGKSP